MAKLPETKLEHAREHLSKAIRLSVLDVRILEPLTTRKIDKVYDELDTATKFLFDKRRELAQIDPEKFWPRRTWKSYRDLYKQIQVVYDITTKAKKQRNFEEKFKLTRLAEHEVKKAIKTDNKIRSTLHSKQYTFALERLK